MNDSEKADKEEGFAEQVLRELQETYSLFTTMQESETDIKVQRALRGLNVFDEFLEGNAVNHNNEQSSRRDFSVNRLMDVFAAVCNQENDFPIDTEVEEVDSLQREDGIGLPRTAGQRDTVEVDESNDEQLNAQQNRALLATTTWLNATVRYQYDPIRNACPPPLLLHISGQAGSGKSFFVQSLAKRIGVQRIACTSFMGVAASNLPRGVTINSEFAIAVPGARTPSVKRKAVARAHLQEVKIVIIGY